MPMVTGFIGAPVAVAMTPAPIPLKVTCCGDGPPVTWADPLAAPIAAGVNDTQNCVVSPGAMDKLVSGGISVNPVPVNVPNRR